jgi:hypothetical protein
VLASFLGDIDAPSETVLIAQLQGLRPACSGQTTFNPESAGLSVQKTATGYKLHSKWDECGVSIGEQMIEVNRDGTTGALEPNDVKRSNCAVGRRPAGLLLSAASSACEPLAEHLGACLRLEAASVAAFLRLARELSKLLRQSESRLQQVARALADHAIEAARTSRDQPEPHHASANNAFNLNEGGANRHVAEKDPSRTQNPVSPAVVPAW